MDETEASGGTRREEDSANPSSGPLNPARSDNGGWSGPATEREADLEGIVADFLLRREEGEDPTVDEYLARYPRYAEDIALLLSDHLGATVFPAREGSFSANEPATARLGNYEILEQVAEGGGGTVYRARHAKDRHVVALKVLDRIVVGDQRDVERFRREVRLLRALDLVSIVPVYEVGEEKDRVFFAMKWIEGSNLASLREEVKNPAHRLHAMVDRARLIARLARTFHAVHGYGFIHRDVKPSNVMVDRLGEPVIIDFGIAQAKDFGELTQSGDGLMGTPRYLSPEILVGGNDAASEQSDVYGLGLCLYELATGSPAFFQKQRAELFDAIRRTGPPAPRTMEVTIPRTLEAIILRAIEIEPRRRYGSMAEFAEDLESFLKGAPLDAETMRRARPLTRWLTRNRRRLPVYAAAACAVVCLVIYGASWLLRRAELNTLRDELKRFYLVPDDVLPPGHSAGESAARRALKIAPDDPSVRLYASWSAFLVGEKEEALRRLGQPASGEREAAGLLREYLSVVVKAARAPSNEQTPTISTLPGMQSPDGKTEGDRFDAEIVESRDLNREADARRRLRMPPALRDLEAWISGNHPKDDDARFLLAFLHWRSLPSDLGVLAGSNANERIDEGLMLSSSTDEGTVAWTAFVRGVLTLRYGSLEAAREFVRRLPWKDAEWPALAHAFALANVAWLGPGGDHEAASAAFEKAAALYEKHWVVAPEFRSDPMLQEPVRKLYAAWALHELSRGQSERLGAILESWGRAVDQSIWQDRVFPLLLRSLEAEQRKDFDAQLAFLRAAQKEEPKFVVPYRELARCYRDHLDEPDAAERVLALSQECPIKRPESLQLWLSGSYFGLRPYSPKAMTTTTFVPLRHGEELRPR